MSVIEASDKVRRSAEFSIPPELRVGAAGVEYGLIKEQGIGDAIAHVGVDLEPLVVGHQHLLRLAVEREDPFVDIDHGVGERPFEIETGRADQIAHRLAETQDERLFGGIDDEYRHPCQSDDDRSDDGDRHSAKGAPHFAPPDFCCSGSSAI